MLCVTPFCGPQRKHTLSLQGSINSFNALEGMGEGHFCDLLKRPLSKGTEYDYRFYFSDFITAKKKQLTP